MTRSEENTPEVALIVGGGDGRTATVDLKAVDGDLIVDVEGVDDGFGATSAGIDSGAGCRID